MKIQKNHPDIFEAASRILHQLLFSGSHLRCIFLLLLLAISDPAAGISEPRPNDAVYTAITFGDIQAPPAPNLTPPPLWETGMEHKFNVLNVSTGVMQEITARIFLITGSSIFWIDDQEQMTVPDAVTARLQAFDMQTLPMLRNTFGEENIPGVDNDPRFHVVFTRMIGESYNGYFSADDNADPRIRPSSNGKELVFLNTSLLLRGPDAVINTLSHEFQHMVHYHYDTNEPSFINEGLSGLSEYLALGKISDNFIRNYLSDTGRSLIWWPGNNTTAPYYGSSFLFSVYLYDRFGADFIRELVKEPGNGLDGLDRTLQTFGLSFTADDLFRQWTAALTGQLTRQPVLEWDYTSFAFPQDGIYRDIKTLPCGISEEHETAQYGIRVYNSSCPGPFRITIEGKAESPVTGLNIPQGKNAWWSGAVSNSMAALSHDFDLQGADGPAFLDYDANYAIENGYDYYYLLLRDENGEITRLAPSSATDDDPSGQNWGSGTTGKSGGWVHESVDLSEWFGQKIRLSFIYLTDTAGLEDGLLLDNFRIAAIDFSDDTENDDSGWEAEGFSRIPDAVPQRFSAVILHPQQDGTSTAEFAVFDGGESCIFECPEGGCTFAVSPVNREIRSRASFSVKTDF